MNSSGSLQILHLFHHNDITPAIPLSVEQCQTGELGNLFILIFLDST